MADNSSAALSRVAFEFGARRGSAETTGVVSREYNVGREVWVRCQQSRVLERLALRNPDRIDWPYQLGIIEAVDESGHITVNLDADLKVVTELGDCLLASQADPIVTRDLATVLPLNEATTSEVLRERFEQDYHFINAGQILLSIHNPMQVPDEKAEFDEVLAARMRKQHLEVPAQSVVAGASGTDRMDVQPHIFSICRQAWAGVASDRKSRTIIFSGVSGSGKTMIARQVLRFFAAPTLGPDKPSSSQKELGVPSSLVQAAGIVMDAFGTAVMPSAPSSSRFTGLTKLQIDIRTGYTKACETSAFMVETERVISAPGKGQRNFNIFYQFMEGLPKTDLSRLFPSFAGDPRSYTVLKNNVGKLTGEENLFSEKTLPALKTIGCTAQEIDDCKRIVAAVALCGEVEFFMDTRAGADRTVRVRNYVVFESVCGLLHVMSSNLQAAVMQRFQKAPGSTEAVALPATLEQAQGTVLGIAKLCYGQLIQWLVRKMNKAMAMGVSIDGPWIAVLDARGFEQLEVNMLEQFVCNYMNEKFQQFFYSFNFRAVQTAYEAEGFEVPKPTLAGSNHEVIELCDGMAGILDEHSLSLGGDESRFVAACYDKFRSHPKYDRGDQRGSMAAPVARMSKPSFIIQHSQGRVEYNASQWRERNLDQVSSEVLTELKASHNSTVRQLAERVQLSSRATGHASRMGQCDTTSREILGVMGSSDPYFVQCIRSVNPVKRTSELQQWDGNLVLDQIRRHSIIEVLHVAQKCHPYRKPIDDFLRDFEALRYHADFEKHRKKRGTAAERAERLLNHYGYKSGNEFILGNTMVFLRQDACNDLDNRQKEALMIMRRIASVTQRLLRSRNEHHAYSEGKAQLSKIQHRARNYLRIRPELRSLQLQRRVFAACLVLSLHPRHISMPRAACVIQRNYRGHVVRMNFLRSGMLLLLRAHLQAIRARRVLASVKTALRCHEASSTISAWWRGAMARAIFALKRHEHRMAVKIQKLYRGFRDRQDPVAQHALANIKQVRKHYYLLNCAMNLQNSARYLLEKQHWDATYQGAWTLQEYFNSGGLLRCLWLRKRRCALKIQAAMRGSLCRRRLCGARVAALWNLERKAAHERSCHEARFISEMRKIRHLWPAEQALPEALHVAVSTGSFGLPYPHGWLSALAELLGRGEILTSLAVGSQHTVVAFKSGIVYTWGLNHCGQLGHSIRNPTAAMAPVSIRSDAGVVGLGLPRSTAVSMVACGADHAAVCTVDGHVLTWGDNRFGQCGQGWDPELTYMKPGLVEFQGAQITTLSLGPRHCAALSSAGSLWMWGERKGLGLSHLEARTHGWQLLVWDSRLDIEATPRFLKPKELSKLIIDEDHQKSILVDQVSAIPWPVECSRLVLAKLADSACEQKQGSVCLLSTRQWKLVAQRAAPLAQVTTAGQGHLAVSKKHFLYGWGVISPPQPRRREVSMSFDSPTRIMSFVRCGLSVARVAAGPRHALALTSNGHVFQWGSLECADLTTISGRSLGFRDMVIPEPKYVEGSLKGKRVSQIEASIGDSIVRLQSGDVFGWSLAERALDGQRLLPALYQYRHAKSAEAVTLVYSRSFSAVLGTCKPSDLRGVGTRPHLWGSLSGPQSARSVGSTKSTHSGGQNGHSSRLATPSSTGRSRLGL
eukprot:gnl/MRDRNA2_/MRDRNA2_57690_c0_seq1.p1 gnl/MRDRNA2_/MRDRNA2_57690_c0~~gnl/MRDRNA2_/MRDRNA2_57690_c0_seq1.p1  ORF type:complete len:1643 (+),score=270.29 gnl/MRDRNA2_/MRDRNA2_57690_c0_seq1:76-5004(+)